MPSANYSRVVELEAYSPVNVALSSNGGIVTASSTINSNYPTVAANNGDRKGLNWGAGGGWNDATSAISTVQKPSMKSMCSRFKITSPFQSNPYQQ